jgi:hypothetical protein
MHILEFMEKDKQFSAVDVISESVNSLLARLYDYKIMNYSDDEDMGKVVESWRNELFLIRNAIQSLK